MRKLEDILRQARDWLDERGKGAWIAAMVLGFIFVWPLGLAVLFYMIWSGRMDADLAAGAAKTDMRAPARRATRRLTNIAKRR